MPTSERLLSLQKNKVHTHALPYLIILSSITFLYLVRKHLITLHMVLVHRLYTYNCLSHSLELHKWDRRPQQCVYIESDSWIKQSQGPRPSGWPRCLDWSNYWMRQLIMSSSLHNVASLTTKAGFHRKALIKNGGPGKRVERHIENCNYRLPVDNWQVICLIQCITALCIKHKVNYVTYSNVW